MCRWDGGSTGGGLRWGDPLTGFVEADSDPCLEGCGLGVPGVEIGKRPYYETAFARTGLACSGRGWHGNQCLVLRKLLKMRRSYFKQQMVEDSMASHLLVQGSS